MRWFFALLLLTNVAFFGWQTWLAEPVSSVRVSYAGTKPEHGLVLLTELPPEQKPRLRDSAESTAAVDEDAVVEPAPEEPDVNSAVVASGRSPDTPAAEFGTNACYQSGGYDSAAELKGISKALKGYGATDLDSHSIPGVRRSYWLMLPPYKSREKAVAAAKILQGRKVKDFFIIRSGEFENAVSLGVYSSMERAQHRAGEITALKLRLRTPQIEVREIETQQHQLRFMLQSDDADGVFAKMAATFGDATFTKIDCK